MATFLPALARASRGDGSPHHRRGARVNVVGISLGLLIGLSLGLLGGGGSTLTVPIFVYVLGFEPKTAIAASLAVVGTTSLVGALGHWRAGNVHPRTALAFGAVAMAGAYMGAHLAARIAGAVQLSLFALVMLVSAYFMARGRRRGPDVPRGADAPAPPARRAKVAVVVPAAAAVGVLTGMLGVGGGFLIVPALILLARVSMHEAVGTSLLVITMNAAAGLSGYLGRLDIPWASAGAFAAAAVIGILLGTRIIRHVPQETLRRAFAVFLVLMGAFILYSNRSVVPGLRAADAVPAATTAPQDREMSR